MTVKEIFDLRKQGKIEEAYEAIRPMYAVHQGKYTTLCMFWTASDILKKRIAENRTDEARKIFEALLRVLPNIEDADGRAHSAIVRGALRLKKACPAFSMLGFLEHYGVDKLSDADWQDFVPTKTAGNEDSTPQRLPSPAQQMLRFAFEEIQLKGDADSALKVMPMLQEAMRRNPRYVHNHRYMAVIYCITGEQDKAREIYRQLLTRHHESYLYAELAQLTDEPGPKAALLCRAIENQRQERFCTAYRYMLATLLAGNADKHAAYELKKCMDTRQALGYPINRQMLSLQEKLSTVEPAGRAEQLDFYRRMEEKFHV